MAMVSGVCVVVGAQWGWEGMAIACGVAGSCSVGSFGSCSPLLTQRRTSTCAVPVPQAYADYSDMMDLTEAIIRTCAQVGWGGGSKAVFRCVLSVCEFLITLVSNTHLSPHPRAGGLRPAAAALPGAGAGFWCALLPCHHARPGAGQDGGGL